MENPRPREGQSSPACWPKPGPNGKRQVGIPGFQSRKNRTLHDPETRKWISLTLVLSLIPPPLLFPCHLGHCLYILSNWPLGPHSIPPHTHCSEATLHSTTKGTVTDHIPGRACLHSRCLPIDQIKFQILCRLSYSLYCYLIIITRIYPRVLTDPGLSALMT